MLLKSIHFPYFIFNHEIALFDFARDFIVIKLRKCFYKLGFFMRNWQYFIYFVCFNFFKEMLPFLGVGINT